ncbi:MAG: NFACT family protein [Erysipelotrichaceae bacterium]|nr:NFACT family protein [Erysipelotrichaceae bacterium]
MALDGIILSCIKKELDEQLPMRINKISELSSTEIVFQVLANRERTNLLISLHSNYNRIALTKRQLSSSDNPGGFVMLLRKHLNNGIIWQIDQNCYDRYLLLHIRTRDELYDERHFLLSVELMGKYANLVLVDEDTGRILDALKRIPPFENTRRTILSGAVFTLPEPQGKQDPFNDPQIDLNESLVAQLAGFSKLLEQEVRYRLPQQSFAEIMQEIAGSDQLYICHLPNKDEYHILPLTHLGECRAYPLFEGFEQLYADLEEKEQIKEVTSDLYKFVRRQMKHYQTKLVKLQDSLEEALHPESERTNGELLYTYGSLDQKGLSRVELEDYEGKTVTIPLNPRLSVKENANKYFQAYRKKRKGKEHIENQIMITEDELAYLEMIDEQLSFANYQDALGIREELVKAGYLRSKGRPQRSGKVKKIKLYELEYKGARIRFGKNNIQNEYLTFKAAGANDLWFHAQGYHGSHLVLSGEANEETIRLCACLAAYFSKGRYSSSVPVDYCRVRDIKKIKGARTGYVSIRNQKTIYIDPELDPELVIKYI